MIRSLAAAAASAVLTLSCAGAQETFTAQQARADLAELYEGLQRAHYDLFERTPKRVFDQRYEALRRAFDGPVAAEDLHTELQRFVALAQHGHARINTPNPAWSAHLEAGGRLFPLDLAVHEGEVIVTGAPETAAVRPGDRILAIDAMANPIWLERIMRNISAETPALAHSIIERFGVVYFWIEFGDQAYYDITYERDGERRSTRIEAVDFDTWRASGGREDAFTLDGREAGMASPEIAYLRPGPFYNLQARTEEEAFDPDAVAAFVDFIDESFAGFIEAGAQALVLDLRDNPGGDSSFSDPMIAWFADRPFKYVSQFRLKVSPETTASNQARLDARPEGQGGVSARYAELFATARNGETVLFDVPAAQPREGRRFEGEVYVLVNRFSYSNAVSAAALIQDYGFGVILGEPTRDMATSFGAMETFTLENSGFRVGYAKAHIIRPNGEARLHALTPDIALPAPVIRGERDLMLEAAVELIAARH